MATAQRTVAMMQCRECGRATESPPPLPLMPAQDEFYPLICMHAYCRTCLATLARTSLLVHALIPLRCCQRRVPVEWVEAVLEPPEAGYYRFLAAKTEMRPTPTLPPPFQPPQPPSVRQPVGPLIGAGASSLWTARAAAATATGLRCESCFLRTEIESHEVLDCGHGYCSGCLESHCLDALDIDLAPSVPPCCSLQMRAMHEGSQVPLVGSNEATMTRTQSSDGQTTTSSMIIIDDDEQDQVTPPGKGSSRRSSKRIRSSRAKTKTARVELTSDESRDADGEVDLVNARELIVVDDSTAGTAHLEGERSQRCVGCNKVVVMTTEAPCGHSFCLKCIGDRCRQVVRNDKDGGIGLPLRCCNVLFALEMVRPALSKQAFGQYKALVIKREGDLKQLSKRKRSTGKQKASAASKAATAGKRARVNQPTTVGSVAVEHEPIECVSCFSQINADVQRQFRGPCGHVYCAECLGLMARKSLEDRALVPIRCCGTEMPVEYIASVLPKRMLGTYNRFVGEKDWKTSNLHSDKEYGKLVKTVGGKQCPKCGIGVQKISGCNTMSCSHGHRFCWQCASDPCACRH